MTDAPEREIAYQTYLNEVMHNGNTRLDNTILCNVGDRAEQHIATQIDLAFQAGWSAHAEAAEVKLAEADERIAWLDCGFEQAMADTRAAEARMAHLENHIEGVAKDTHSTMLQYEAALVAVYRLALEDAYWSREVTPTPTTVELMARIKETGQ